MFRGEGFDFMKNVLDPNNFISLYFLKILLFAVYNFDLYVTTSVWKKVVKLDIIKIEHC